MSDDKVKIKYRVNDREIEVEGSQEFVMGVFEQFKRQFDTATVFLPASSAVEVAVEENNGNHASEDVQETPKTDQRPDFLKFFLEKNPAGNHNQKYEVLTITFYYQRFLGYESLTLEDYQAAYKQLKRAGVEEPSNYKSSVRNVVDRTNLLYNSERGKFALTLQGEDLVSRLPNVEKEK